MSSEMHSLKTRLRNHYLPLLILTALTMIVFRFAWKTLTVIPFLTRATGYIGLFLIAVSMLTGPLNIVLKRRNPLSSYFRRDIGIFGGTVAVVHSITGLFVHLHGQMWKYFLEKTAGGYVLKFDDFRLANYTGLIAALLILALLITSNDLSVVRLKPQNWKALQRLAYIMFPLIVVHTLFYRLMSKHLAAFWYFYLPVFVVVVLMQLTGFMLKRQAPR